MTPELVRSFQRGSVDWSGVPLTVDGRLGPRTEWALAVSRHPLARRRIVARVTAYVGLVELPNNRGLEIEQWLTRAGAKPGDPWCASYASWCISVEGLASVKMPGALNLLRRFSAVAAPMAGDLFGFPTDAKGHGHVEIVVGCSDLPGELVTVGGNVENGVRVSRRLSSDGTCTRVTPELAPIALPVIPSAGIPLRRATYSGTR